MKKLALILALVLAAAMFMAACDATPQPAAPGASVSGDMVLAWWGNPLRNEMTEGAVALFEGQYQNVTVDMQTVGWGDYWPLLSAMAAGGELPDVIQMDYAYLEQYVGSNLLVDLTPYIQSGAIDMSNVPENVIATGRLNNGIYAVSIGMNGPSMFYNKTLLDSIGITINDHMTIDQFKNIAREVYAKTGYRSNFVYTDPSNPIEVFLRARGIVMLTPEGMGGTVEDYYEFFEFLEEGIKEGWHIHPESMVGRTGTEQDPLLFGADPSHRSWMSLHFSNQLASFQNAAPDGLELRMTTYPSSNPALGNYIRSSMYFSISSQSNNKDAAAALINFWTNSVEANNIILAERGIPASTVIADAIAPNMSPANVLAAEHVEKVAGHGSPVNPPRPDGAAEIVSHLRVLTENVGHGQMTGRQAAADFYAFGNSILK